MPVVLNPAKGGDPWTAAGLLEAGRAAQRSEGPLLINCADMEFLDTGVLQVLIALRQALSRLGRPMIVIGLSESVARYLKLAGLTEAVMGPSEKCEE
jgi:anti-anti-sigma factor